MYYRGLWWQVGAYGDIRVGDRRNFQGNTIVFSKNMIFLDIYRTAYKELKGEVKLNDLANNSRNKQSI